MNTILEKSPGAMSHTCTGSKFVLKTLNPKRRPLPSKESFSYSIIYIE